MHGIIDIHTHAFPDHVAARAVAHVQRLGGIQPTLDGRLDSLRRSMDTCGIETAVVSAIATKPAQFDSILEWNRGIACDRVIPFLSFHPDDPQWSERIDQIKNEGFKGVKLHPYYQDFRIDDQERLFPIYEKLARTGLILLMHTGYDFAFPRDPIADPPKILTVIENFPTLKFVASHFGAWQDWQRVLDLLVGKPIYIETSFSLGFIADETAKHIILNHPETHILFGSDSPWADQKDTIDRLKHLQLGEERETLILRDNAQALLAGTP